MNSNRLDIYTNIDKALKEVKDYLKKRPNKFYRIGTGELTDSLSIDNITNGSSTLIPFFIKQKNALLELKTKSNNINNLLKFKPKGNIVISWSLNPQKIIDQYETGSASLSQRLEAAKKCSELGYKIAFHLDPIILHDNWEKDYSDLIDNIFKYVNPKDIIWVSVACFRYTQNLKNVILERFPKTKIFLGEMIRCEDGKYRYIRPIRVNIYRKIITQIKNYGENIPIYFCMESPAVWLDVFGKLPHQMENLKEIFY